jgi:hypothetical protein
MITFKDNPPPPQLPNLLLLGPTPKGSTTSHRQPEQDTQPLSYGPLGTFQLQTVTPACHLTLVSVGQSLSSV